MTVEYWEEEIRKGLADEPLVVLTPVARPKLQGWLVLAVMLLGVGLGVAAYKKDKTLFGLLTPREQVNPISRVSLSGVETGQFGEIVRELGALRVGQAGIKTDLDALGKRVDRQADKVTMMGIIISDNAEGAKAGDRDLMSLNADWTLSRMPRYLRTDADGKQFLSDHVSPQ